jgi:hypothetical protein
MLDLYMVLMMVGGFALLYGFLAWCSRVVDETGGDRK